MLQSVLLLLYSLFTHPFYTSLTEINHISAKKTIEMNCRIFYDDLHAVIENQNHVKFDIVKPANRALVNKLISDYVKKHLTVTADGRPVNFTFIRYEIHEDGAWCYFRAASAPVVKKMHVYNALLYEEHDDQINIVNVTLAGKRQTVQLNTNDVHADFPF